MARKRMSSEVDAQPHTNDNMVHGPGREDRAAAVWEQFNQLCRAARLDLPIGDNKSPDRGLQESSNKLWQAYKHLSWKNPQRLSEEVGNFLSSVAPGQASHGSRLGLLLDTLKTASEETATPKSHKFQKSVGSSRAMPAFLESTQPYATADYQASSPSPSPSKVRFQANLKSSFKTTKAGASISPSTKPVQSKTPEETQRQQHQRLLFAAPLKPPLFKEPPPPPLPAAQRPTISATNPAATTSFGSTVANTSFGQNTSFGSSQGTQKSFQTDATSFSDALPAAQARESTNYGSSLSSTSAEKWLEACKQFESSQKSSSTDKTIRPTTLVSADSGASNSTKYSTAPTSPLKENPVRSRRALDRVFQSSVQASDYGSSIGTTLLDDPENYRFEPVGIFDHDMPDAPNLATVPMSAPESSEKLSFAKTRLPAMHFEPASTFARLAIPMCFNGLPFLVLWEAQRLVQTGSISPDDLAAKWKPRDMRTLYDIAANVNKSFEGAFASSDPISLEQTTFSARLQYSQSGSGPIFELVLDAPKQDKSCDLQRRYGADRVLYVDVPSMSKPPQLHKGRDIMSRFSDMASKAQAFLGRRWVLFVVQPNKQSKNSTVSGSNRLIFFAIDDMPVGNLFDDIVPYYENAHQPARKLYTRLELSLSRTIAALQFHEDDIDFMADDQFATRHPDDCTFLDPDLRRQKALIDPESNFDPKLEMSDGCAMLSSWAYWQVHKALGMTNVRSAFQARVGGAKGVWYKNREDFTFDEQKPPGKHIKLARSQVKVNRSTLTGCNAHTLSLNVVKFNSYAKTSLMHTGFMPILLDRGVPKQVMLDVIRTQVRRETDQFEEAVRGGSHTLRRWMHSQNSMFEERNRQKEMQIRPDGLTESREERIVQLLEAGFDQNSLPYLAREVKIMAQQAFDLKKKNYKIKLDRSTTLMGIADPFGCLKPGEIHVNFSSPFVEATTGMSWMKLEMDGLIARNPALAPWDIQKVRFVCKKELEHLTDLFVFPTKGRRPLAGMLQGGDYDGDTFWGFWEPKFARFFKNAPCPYAPPPVEQFGIVKRKETLRHYVRNPQSDSEWCKWLGEMAVARLGMNLLGVVTKLHERLVYKTGDLGSRPALQLVHLHDYLVDADKQGYDFSFEALNDFKKSIDLPSSLPDPAYWQILKADRNGTDYENEPEDYPVDKTAVVGNIIDEAYFNVIQPVMAESLLRVQAMLAVNEKHDTDLTKVYDQMLLAAADTPAIEKALRDLKADLKQVREYYGCLYSKKHPYEDLLKAVRHEYDQVLPHDIQDPTIIEWLRSFGDGDLSLWDKLKASALAKFQHGPHNPGNFIFSVAGGELCKLKLAQMGRTREIVLDQYRMLKLRKERTVELRDEFCLSDDRGEEEGEGGDDEDGVGDTGYY